jgi:hypothetical protein
MKKNRIRYPAGKGVAANVRVGGRANKTKLEELAKGVSVETVLKSFHSSLEKHTDSLKWHKNNVPSKATLHSSTKA